MADELLPVYLLTGTDRPKIGRALRRLRTRFGDEAVEVLSAETVSGEDVAAALNSLGLFGAGRLILVQGVEKWKEADADGLLARDACRGARRGAARLRGAEAEGALRLGAGRVRSPRRAGDGRRCQATGGDWGGRDGRGRRGW